MHRSAAGHRVVCLSVTDRPTNTMRSATVTMGWRDALLFLLAVGSSHTAVDRYQPRFGTTRVRGGRGLLELRGGDITGRPHSRVSLDARLSLLLPDASGEDLAKLKMTSTEAHVDALALKLANQCDRKHLRTLPICLDCIQAAWPIFDALAIFATLMVPIRFMEYRCSPIWRKIEDAYFCPNCRDPISEIYRCRRECTSLYKSLVTSVDAEYKCYLSCVDGLLHGRNFLKHKGVGLSLKGLLLLETATVSKSVGIFLAGAALFTLFYGSICVPLIVLATRLIRIWHPVEFRQAMLEKMERAPKIFGLINRVNRLLDCK